jgi:hypothetical protein
LSLPQKEACYCIALRITLSFAGRQKRPTILPQKEAYYFALRITLSFAGRQKRPTILPQKEAYYFALRITLSFAGRSPSPVTLYWKCTRGIVGLFRYDSRSLFLAFPCDFVLEMYQGTDIYR